MNKNKLLTVLCCLLLFEMLLIPVSKAQEPLDTFQLTKENLAKGRHAHIRKERKKGKKGSTTGNVCPSTTSQECPTFTSFQSRLGSSYKVLLGPLTDGTLQSFQLNVTMLDPATGTVGYTSVDLLNGITFADGAGNIYFDSFNFPLPVAQGGKLTVYDCFVFLDILAGTCSGIAIGPFGNLLLTPTLITLEQTL